MTDQAAFAETESVAQARAYNRQAIELAQRGKLADSEALFRRAVELWPAYAEAHNNLGNVLSFQGKLADAVASYEAALRLRPEDADLYSNLGHVLWKQNRLDEAVQSCQHALRLRPNFAEAFNHLGLALQSQGKWADAEACFRESVRLRPDLADPCCNLGHCLWRQGNLSQASFYCEQALRLRPDFSDAYNNLGLVRQDQGNFADAEACYREGVRLRPDFTEAHNNLGSLLVRRGRLEEGERSCRTALSLRPGFAEAYVNLAIGLCRQGKLDEALSVSQEVVRLKPNYAHANSVMGIACMKRGDLTSAVKHFSRAIELKPDYGDAHMNLGITLLLLGDFERGWREYDWRWQSTFGTGPLPSALWDGSPLAGRSIVLYAEQGLGDTLQFIRYAPLVKRQGGTVTVVCQRPLLSLLSRCHGIDRLLAQEEPVPKADVYAPLLNLPRLLGTRLETIPAEVPYLFADAALVEEWSRQIHRPGHFKVGIVWRGSPDHPEDRYRSVPVGAFAALARLDGVRLYSLQVGAGAEQLAGLPQDLGIMDIGSHLRSFEDSAAVARNMNLIVTIDTALAHLAGGLGVPVWLLLPFAPDWRWLLEREDSPWYPTMRLFRQSRWGDWDDVFRRVAEELAKTV